MSIPPAPTSAQPPEFAIASPDPVIEAALRKRIDAKTKPLGALGRVEEMALRLGLIQGTTAPQIIRPTMVVFAADHGAARAGISAYPQEVTWQMVENFLAGGAAINVFARRFGWQLRIVDAGVAHDFGARPGLEDAKIGTGTANYLESAAMSTAQRDRAIAAGARIATEVADSGATVIAFGEMGIGNTASASLLTHRLTGLPLAACIGRGTGLDDAGLARKQELLAHAAARAPDCSEPLSVLAEFGGFEIAMMAGAFLAAAEHRLTIVVDGFIVTAALLVAARLRPEVLDYCLFAHRSGEPGHHLQIEALGGRALLDLGLRLGEGTGAALALPLLEAACAMLAEMASFDSAGVATRHEASPQ